MDLLNPKTITALHRKNNTLLASGWDFILYKKFNDFYIFYSFLGLSFLDTRLEKSQIFP